MTADEHIELGRVCERLMEHKDFQLMWDSYVTNQRLEITEMFNGDTEQIERLTAIRLFADWFNNNIDNAKILLKD
jgi:hypothetical protein